MVQDRYKLWTNSDSVRFFSEKSQPTLFFKSETHFLARIKDQINSVLDVGCACGRFVELLKSMDISVDFAGIDIVPENIDQARRIYPDFEFYLGNATEIDLRRRFDLVNATGVFQHEPKFESLLGRMIELSSRYVMFDVKFAAVDDHLVDINLSYVEKYGHRSYFNCLNYERFLSGLKVIDGIGRIEIFGYVTDRNEQTTTPDYVGDLVSASVLLEKCEGDLELQEDVPDFLRQ
jgi:SAM-dependent methyltransferase